MQSIPLRLRKFHPVILCLAIAIGSGFARGDDERRNTPTADLHDATTRAVRLIDRTSAEFLKTRECFTCHTQTLSAMVLSDARTLGFDIDEENFKRQIDRVSEVGSSLDGLRVDTVGYGLWTLNIGERATDDMTGRMTAYLLRYQQELGHWKVTVDRPPAEASHFTTNYVAIRGLNRYGTGEQRKEIAERTAAVRQWMKTAKAATTEDEVFRLRLAKELEIDPETMGPYVEALLNRQHTAGGWSQLPDGKPDAYATGSVLVALHEAGGVLCDNPAWRRGLEYLLATQKEDGSWHVVTRAKPIQEYFESGFPHGQDQFISAFATGWATKSLLLALRHAAEDAPAPVSGEALKGRTQKEQAPTTSTPSGWQLRAIAGKVSTPNPEHGSGTPFRKGDDWHRYARIATVSFDPPSAGNWSTMVRSVITVDTVVRLEAGSLDTNKWTAVPGKPLFTARYSRFVEARIDDAGAVTFDFDDDSPATDPEHHLAATIVPSVTGHQVVTISGPHNGAAPYNLPSDTMNARCLFQKRKGTNGVPTDVPTDP